MKKETMSEDLKTIKHNSAGCNNYGAVSEVNSASINHEATPEPPPGSIAQQPHSVVGILLVMLGSFSFSCMFFLVKILEGTADSFTLVFYRCLVQISISLTSILFRNEHPLGEPRARGWLLIRGGFGAASVLAFFYAIQNLPLPDAVILQFTTPVFAAAFAVCLAGEQWMILDMVGAVVCTIGVALIAHPSTEEGPIGDNTAFAIFVALIGAAMAGMAYMSVRLVGERTSANVMVLYYSSLSIPVALIGSKWFLGKWSIWGDDIFSAWDYFLFLLTGLSGYGGQYFTNLGLQREAAATATLATCTQIVWIYIFELAFLHEAINGRSLSGTGLILGFMLVVGYSKMKQVPSEGYHSVAGVTEKTSPEQDAV